MYTSGSSANVLVRFVSVSWNTVVLYVCTRILKVNTALFFPSFLFFLSFCLSVYCTLILLQLFVCFGCEYAAFPQVIWREPMMISCAKTSAHTLNNNHFQCSIWRYPFQSDCDWMSDVIITQTSQHMRKNGHVYDELWSKMGHRSFWFMYICMNYIWSLFHWKLWIILLIWSVWIDTLLFILLCTNTDQSLEIWCHIYYLLKITVIIVYCQIFHYLYWLWLFNSSFC